MSCDACGGFGHAPVDDQSDQDAELLVEHAEFLRAYGMIRRHGVDGWMRLDGIASSDEIDESFIDAMEIFDHEISELEHE